MLFLYLTSLSLAGENVLYKDVFRELSMRDTFMGCEQLYQLDETPKVREALMQAAKTQSPPWAAMRAVECMTKVEPMEPSVQQAAELWVTDPDLSGLALVVLRNLDAFPEERALSIATLAIGRFEENDRLKRSAQRYVSASRHPMVRALIVEEGIIPMGPQKVIIDLDKIPSDTEAQ